MRVLVDHTHRALVTVDGYLENSSELAETTGMTMYQRAAPSIDRRVRVKPLVPMNESGNGVTAQCFRAMIAVDVRVVKRGPGVVPPGNAGRTSWRLCFW